MTLRGRFSRSQIMLLKSGSLIVARAGNHVPGVVYTLSVYARNYLHAPRRERRRAQLDQNGRAQSALRLAQTERPADIRPERQRYFQQRRKRSVQTGQANLGCYRKDLWLPARRDAPHHGRIARGGCAEPI